jgi:hypothetical protein
MAKKRRTPAQIRATKKLVAMNKARARKGKRNSGRSRCNAGGRDAHFFRAGESARAWNDLPGRGKRTMAEAFRRTVQDSGGWAHLVPEGNKSEMHKLRRSFRDGWRSYRGLDNPSPRRVPKSGIPWTNKPFRVVKRGGKTILEVKR